MPDYLYFLLPVMIVLFLTFHPGTLMSHVLEWAQNQYEADTVLTQNVVCLLKVLPYVLRGAVKRVSPVVKQCANWAWKTITLNDDCTVQGRADVGMVTTYFMFGQHEIWAPAILAMTFMYFVMRFVVGTPEV